MSQINETASLAINLSEPQKTEVVERDIFNEVIEDVFRATKSWRLWTYMSMAEIKRRYRRTVIGPFWTTLNLAIFIFCMGFLLSSLWHQGMKDFLPYFCAGFVCWSLISCVITEGCMTFIAADGLLKQLPLPYMTFSYFTVFKNYIVFAHHMIIFVIVALIFRVPINMNTLLVIPGLILVFISGAWITTFLGLACAKYRDMQQVITSLLQLSMFVTPVFWKPHQMGRKGYILSEVNPLFHLVDIIRSPLLGEAPSVKSYVFIIIMSLIGWFITLRIFAKSYRKLIFWI